MWLEKGSKCLTLFTSNGWEMQKIYWYKRNFGALVTDLLKAFDCLPHKLLYIKIYTSV